MKFKKTLLKDFLSNYLEDAQKKNPNFSLRSFAKKISLSPGILSNVLNGKHELTLERARKILEDLKVSKDEIDLILKPYYLELAIEKEMNFKFIDITNIPSRKYLIYFDFLNLINVERNHSPSFLAKRLGMENDVLIKVINELLGLGLLQFDSSGGFVRTIHDTKTSDNQRDLKLIEIHREVLKRSENYLKSCVNEKQFLPSDFTSMNLGVNLNNVKEAKQLIRNFYKELGNLLEEGNKSEVYTIYVGLFPISKKK